MKPAPRKIRPYAGAIVYRIFARRRRRAQITKSSFLNDITCTSSTPYYYYSLNKNTGGKYEIRSNKERD
jgi:hypothetical protein